jgi:hypothetical protein
MSGWASWSPAASSPATTRRSKPAALGLGVSALVGILQGDDGDSDQIFTRCGRCRRSKTAGSWPERRLS